MQRIADPIERTELFALLDLIQNVLAIALQVLVTRRLLPQWGAGPLMLVAVSVYTLGFFSLIVWTLPVLVYALSSAGRGLNFGLFNPARESLFALVAREERYKAKNFIDTFVYRAADASFQSVLVTLSKLGLVLPQIAAVGLGLSLLLGLMVYVTWRRTPLAARS
jgi:AAA family ATP:ADP antiporter